MDLTRKDEEGERGPVTPPFPPPGYFVMMLVTRYGDPVVVFSKDAGEIPDSTVLVRASMQGAQAAAGAVVAALQEALRNARDKMVSGEAFKEMLEQVPDAPEGGGH